MKLSPLTLIVSFAFLFVFCSSPSLVLAQEAESKPLDDASYRELTEDIEIMRRVLEKALRNHLFDEDDLPASQSEEDLPFWTSSDTGKKKVTRGHNPDFLAGSVLDPHYFAGFASRALYVPASGVVFTLEIEVPAKEISVDNEEEQSAEDLWEETEKELKQGNALEKLAQEKDRKWTLEPDAVDDIRDLLISTVTKHGKRIEHLDRHDRFTLIARLQGTRPLDKIKRLSGDVALSLFSHWSLKECKGLNQEMIIQIPVSCIKRYHQTGDKSEVMDAVKVTFYPGKSGKGSLQRYF